MRWDMVRLGDVCVKEIKTISSNQKGEMVYLDISSVDNITKKIVSSNIIPIEGAPSRAKQILMLNDIILSTVRPNLNAVAINNISHDKPVVASTGYCVLRCNNDLDYRYLFQYCLTDTFVKRLTDIAKGSSYPAVVNTDVFSQKILLPPINEQRRIAAETERQLAAAEKAKRAAAEQLAAAREFNAAYLREVFAENEGVRTRLGDVCTFEGGSQPPKSTFKYSPQEGYIRLIQIQDYRRDDMAVYIPAELARRFCKRDDVMIGRYGPPVFQILRGLEGAYNVALMKAYPKDEDKLDNGFLYYLLQEENIQNAVIEQSQRSAGQTGVDKDFLESRNVFLPDIDIQRRIVSQIETNQAASVKILSAVQSQLDMINALSAAILRQAFSGQM